ncbi:Dynein alpha chain, flagellar outer arm [Phytophthora ramorum]|uniref:Dynein alpha chain, flagellar outer arm n=1 Tax=Phytophthora ramorum TaxID=164328 RepID=UPI0030B589E5|nr:Dynein alpha chain, flagellar outer arm [Phytophthora ramorum]
MAMADGAPPALRWSRLETTARRNGETPTRRSGHSLSIVGSSGYLFGGCDYSEPPGPTNDLFALKINANAPSEWERLRSPLGGAWPPPRWKHSATVVDNKIYVFGGFHSSSARFNDLWIFNPITLDWSQAGAPGTAVNSNNNNALHRASVAKTVAPTLPAPRGAHSAVAIRRSIYVFGGYGGTGYSRRDFDDLYMLRTDDLSWTKVTCKGKPPEKRAGHQACAVDDLMLVCGGWNSVAQFNDLHIFDSAVNSWTLVEGTHMASTLPRWNHACCAVLAIPHAKVFVFGGVVGEANNYNAQGNYMNDLSVLDTGEMSWSIPEIEGTPPCGRSDTTLAYDDKGSRLIVFGGWANVWLNDMFYLDVSCVVGPPYGITGVYPDFGPITGGTPLVIEGIDFVNKAVTIRFSCRKGSVDVPGEYVNDHTLNVVTPDFTAYPAGDIQIRVALQGDSFTTTFQTYSYFSVTDAPLCFAYGPGVLSGGASGEPTCFIIQARDARRDLRTRGGDEFNVEVSLDDSNPIFLPSLQIQDLLNGKYLVSYTVPSPGEYQVRIEFQGTFGGNAGPIRGSPYTATFDDIVTREMNLMTGKLVIDQVLHDLQGLQQSTRECNIGLEQPLSDPTWTPEQVTAALIRLKEHVFMVEKRGEAISLSIEELRAEIAFLKDAGIIVTKELDILLAIEVAWGEVLKKVPAASNRIAPLIATQSLKFRDEVAVYMEELRAKETQLKTKAFWNFSVGVNAALTLLSGEQANAEKDGDFFQQKKHIAEILECEDLMDPCASVLASIQRTFTHCNQLWEAISEVTRKIDLSRDIPWSMIDGIILEEEAKTFLSLVKATHKDIRDCDAFKKFERLVKDFLSTCPLFQALRHPSMRRRHWQDLIAVSGKTFDCPDDNPSIKFADILALNLHEFQRDVEEITDRAQKEAKQESTLYELENRWSNICLTMTPYKETTVPLLHMAEDDVEMLESDQLLIQGMASGRNSFFQEQTQLWRSKLMLVSETVGALLDIQRSWSYLEPLFMQSEEVKRELPDEAARFEDVDELVRQTLQQMWAQEPPGNVLLACQLPSLLELLNDLRSRLEKCQQALKEYLDSKRRLFPRFYFISEADLLDILSNGSSPQKIMIHLEKVFLATHTLLLQKDNNGAASSMLATHFISNDSAKETISFENMVPLEGKVELYMQTILESIQLTLKGHVTLSINRFPKQNRVDWLLQKVAPVSEGAASKDNMDAAQIALLVAGIEYVRSVENAFELISKGHATAMKELLEKVMIQLSDLIKLTQTNLPKGDRQRTMCMITMDAHSRDIVQKLLYEEITIPSSFLWQSQLKPRRSDHQNHTYLEICDATFDYGFEYLGNGPRLVITPLTDRIYVTATQALHIQMGCAPAGPAGTGKTETTKDLANMVGKVCYVFNCSPEMDYKNLGNIFKGLASAGAWGCFDEFNRLAPEVLSVCSVQFKAVCDGIRGESSHVVVEGDSVTLDPTCGTFITMNPGYLGRSELPEGLKALFRPITVMAPDLVLICENMLMAEGFREAKLLATKFFSLYSLLRELLSKQDHYDWGLRAVKSVLVVAGTFKRAEPKFSEQEILMRSLRDFNLPKIVKQDLLIFTGLLGDLFPNLNLPRKIDEVMEKYVHVACEDRGLWPHEQFRLKVIQLEELLAIRHCVFVMGPPGSGKTECCETLIAARKKKGEQYTTKVIDLNPKSVSTEDLYGYMVLGTREWKDGLLSKIMRDVASSSVADPRPKWIVLDGDLDANWIESMNSVMDDNKMLTLASNERIPLKPNMRLLFEIRDLKYATPATVSRAGILYISDDDGFQWRSFLASWVATKGTSVQQRAALGEAMNKYIDPIISFVKQCCKTIVPMQEITMVQTYLYFLDAVLDAETLRDSKKVDILSGFISVWAFGAALTITDDGTDYRKLFSEWWRSEFKTIKFPARDTVFDYWLDPNTLTFDTWRASPYFKAVHFDGSVAMSSVTVSTPETASITSWMSIMVHEQRPFMLCGNAGTGKTQLVVSFQVLHATVEEALAEHNELNAKMGLVLFKDALEHITRIVRIISNPSGHALLVGVGGSGRKSLARLSTFICGYALVEITITQAYSLLDFKSDLQNMFMKAGVKGDGLVFLFDDNQIKNERMLVYLNDLLSSGNIPDLYNVDEQTNLIQQFQPKMVAALAASAAADSSGDGNEAINLGTEGSEKERAWRWLVQEIKRNLHVVLCFSPATADFRMRARKFPALVNCALIDWFQPWPKEALRSVAARFLSFDNIPQLSPAENVAMAVQNFMPFAFQSTNTLASEFFAREKRRVYSTPKSYLECLTLYRRLLAQKHSRHQNAMQRLQSGLEKMESTGEIVATMEEELKRTLEEAENKKVIVEELAARLQKDKELVENETAKANVEREKCAIIQTDVSAKKADTEADLAQAEPMVEAAMAALDTLNKKDLGNCKTMAKPPAGVGDVFGAVVVLFAGVNPNVIIQKNGKVKDKDRSWEATKKALLGNINSLVDELKGFKTLVDNQQIPEVNWKEIRPFLLLEHFNVEAIEKKNSASAGLCAWVINIVAYYDAIVVVEPKKRALEEANEKLRVANERLELVNQKVAALEEKLAILTEEFDKTNKEVQDAVGLLERGRLRMELARRLAKALGSESERWAHELEQLRVSAEMLVCDVVIAASFVSYVGAFTKPFRDLLINDKWLPFLRKALTEKPPKADKDKDKAAPAISTMSEDGNPLQILATPSEIAEWNTKGLPSDRVSVENGAIVRNSTRSPLLIDPQLQGIYWLREMEKHARRAAPSSLQVVRQDQPNLTQLLETAVEHGYTVIVENMGEKLEVCMWPVISRSTTVRGRKTLLKMGDKLVELHPEFRLYLHTKLSNPHYPPELQAETTMINFAVTQQGLEDQLLALVVRKEWPKMAKVRTALIHQQNEFKIRIQTLEDRILSSLADAEGDVTENVQVITDLETTKATSQEIAKKAAKATEYEAQINELSAKYQSVASRGALLFFIMDGLHRMHSYYVYSLNAYVVIFQRGIDLVQPEKDPGRPPSSGGGGLLSRLKAAAKKVIVSQRFQWNSDLLLADRVMDTNTEQDLDVLMKETDQEEKPSTAQIEARCTQLNASITDVVFNYIRRGLFEKDKLTLATQLCFSILQSEKKIDAIDVHQLVTCSTASDMGSGMGLLSEWLSETMWLRVRKLEENIHSLQKLTTFMRSDSEEWREWCDAEKPEVKPLPGQYKTSVTPVQLLHIVRVLRPDRMIFALRSYLSDTFGKQMVQQPPFDMEATYQETSASTPMFFVLFPGVDPTSWVETLGKKFDFTYERGNLINISMGQGQEEYADSVLMKFSREGNWVILQNIHLMQSWLPRLERTLEVYSVSADQNFRCFLSSEGPALASLSNLPESLLQSCIKVANEAPTDLKSNLRRAWANFSLKQLDACAQPSEYQGCIFALCFFHALVLGRRRFGCQGWSRPYSFNTGDLLICSDVLRRYLDTAATSRSKSLPWDDLRYIFGEIMYGGHITDHWDRITNNTYLNEVFTKDIFHGKELTAGFKCPDPFTFSYTKYVDHIETQLPSESPTVYGLHPNAEVGYLVDASNELFAAIAKFQPSGGPSTSADGTATKTARSAASELAKENAHVYAVIEELLEKLPPEIDLADLQAKADPLLTTDQSPYVVVALQEATRMHTLLHEIQTSLVELTKGIQGTLNMTEQMEDLMEALSINQVPGRNVLHMCSWERYAWWSRKSLSLWFADLLERVQFLSSWTNEFRLPYSMWISGLFNPTAFLTAIKQCTARTHGIPLDSMAIETHVTPIADAEGAESYPEMGAYIHGLFMEGARWEYPMKDGDKTSPFIYEVDSIPCGGHLVDPMPKELLPAAPVIYARAVVIDSKWEATAVGHFRRSKDVFDCPVYQTTLRGPTYVFLATLNTIHPKAKWILAGVALVMQRDS